MPEYAEAQVTSGVPRVTLVDLHIHTALSACGSDEMTPPRILLTAERAGLALVGVVDHNTAGNARAVLDAAPAFAVQVLVGLEVESAEGVHVLALFADADAAAEMDNMVARHLPGLPNSPELFGEQTLLNEWGDLAGLDTRLLAAGTDLDLAGIITATLELGGLALPAHVNRSASGLLPILGFVPPGLQAPALEISRHITPGEARRQWPELANWALLTSSDAHQIADIGAAPTVVPSELAEPGGDPIEWLRRVADALRPQA